MSMEWSYLVWMLAASFRLGWTAFILAGSGISFLKYFLILQIGANFGILFLYYLREITSVFLKIAAFLPFLSKLGLWISAKARQWLESNGSNEGNNKVTRVKQEIMLWITRHIKHPRLAIFVLGSFSLLPGLMVVAVLAAWILPLKRQGLFLILAGNVIKTSLLAVIAFFLIDFLKTWFF